MKKIELMFRYDLCKLAGNSFGREVYRTQVKDRIDLSGKVCIVIPATINRVGSGFVQGFFEDVVRQIGFAGVEERFEFKAPSIPNFKQFILNELN